MIMVHEMKLTLIFIFVLVMKELELACVFFIQDTSAWD